MEEPHVYRCTNPCPIHKRCFVLKTADTLREPVAVYQKCPAEKEDIRIDIGGQAD